jgi:hypothetical protein
MLRAGADHGRVIDMATVDDGVTLPPRTKYRPFSSGPRSALNDCAPPSFTPADLDELKAGQRRWCQQMEAVIVERTDRLVVAIGVRYGRWIALRWTEGRLNGLAFSTRLGTWGSWTNITDCASRFARALLLDEDPILRDRLLADMVKLDRLNDQAP